MTGKDFLEVAEALTNGPSEPYWRSGTSRAYYAAFHVAKDALQRRGIRIPPTAEGHERVIRCLNNSDNEDLAQAATGLGTLRLNRNAADYDLETQPFSQNQGQFDLARAKAIIRHIERSPLEAGNFRRVVRAIEAYLRKMNQWLG